jgi:hypothetical protein
MSTATSTCRPPACEFCSSPSIKDDDWDAVILPPRISVHFLYHITCRVAMEMVLFSPRHEKVPSYPCPGILNFPTRNPNISHPNQFFVLSLVTIAIILPLNTYSYCFARCGSINNLTAPCLGPWSRLLSNYRVCTTLHTIKAPSLTRYSRQQFLGQRRCWRFSSPRAHAQCQGHWRRIESILYRYELSSMPAGTY